MSTVFLNVPYEEGLKIGGRDGVLRHFLPDAWDGWSFSVPAKSPYIQGARKVHFTVAGPGSRQGKTRVFGTHFVRKMTDFDCFRTHLWS